MIERPKRSVTYFFVPLIDVLILLFCIFLLMPFVSTGETETDAHAKVKEKPKDELPKDVKQLQADLEKARREVEKLKAERGNLADRLSVKVLEIDSGTGSLFYHAPDGKKIIVEDKKMAGILITAHSRASGTKEPFFMILYPRAKSGFPEQDQRRDYADWFKDVQFQFDQPFK